MKKASQAIPNKLLICERLQRQWSQKEVAEKVGTTTISVSRWERGITFPNAYFRYQICAVFEKSEEELGLTATTLHTEKSDEFFTESSVPGEQVTPVPLSFPPIWHVPFPRNLLFTGREDILRAIHPLLRSPHNATCILSGLGGIGKTQIALEYAYRYRQKYQAVLWIDASTHETLTTSVAAIASLLPHTEENEQPQTDPIAKIKNWLQSSTNWLLLLDNVEEMGIIEPILANTYSNHILITTRIQIIGMIIPHLDIEEMNPEEGALLLLRRARYIDPESFLQDAPELLRTHARHIMEAMGGLPLALDQAGAYVEETGCSLSSYLSLYRTQGATLLHRRGKVVASHPASVTSTLLQIVEKVEKANAVATDLLSICAFCDSNVLSEETITEKLAHVSDPLMLDAAIAELRRYFLVRRDPLEKTLTIHPLTQVVLREHFTQKGYPQHQLLSLSEQKSGPLNQAPAKKKSNHPPGYIPPAQHQSSHQPINPIQLFARRNWHFARKKSGIFIIISIIALSSILTMLLYPLLGLGKSQTIQGTITNSLAEETRLEAQLFQEKGIGLSDGNFIFDTYAGRMDGNLKDLAASCLRQGNTSCAVNYMTQAISTDASDGELQIYNENLHVRQSGAPYVTVVLGLAIASEPTYLLRARSIMQAAFLAQREINTEGLLPHKLHLRILIDNSGADNAFVATAAQLIANRVRNNNPDHIIAVVGWPFSSQTTNALDIITGMHIPMISQSASSTTLSGSPYFFRVNPTDDQQGQTLGDVAVNQFHAHTILLMQDPTDPYSVSLAQAFSERVTSQKASILYDTTDNFSIGVTTVDTYQKSVIQEAQRKNVNLIFIAGFDVDAVRLAHALGNASRADPGNTFLANLKIMGGDAVATNLILGYGGGTDASIAAQFPDDMRRLIFSAFAHRDEWTFEHVPKTQQPPFFSDWFNTFKDISVDTISIPQPGSHAILTYDALQVISQAIILAQQPTITGEILYRKLVSLGKGQVPPVQGISGLIAFNNQGDPINKAFVLLDIESIDGKNQIVLKQVVGQFRP
ncbi:ABC transporter substrate-binding protein [Tengunoibacter tsumagoiensis]|uniref:HTH cro/C1-type domain-containing protein n=1 Tax=Tengunoibacter tsumagoiensis TaxID=2014871 RepID=A0A402A6U5_9CHLR|nr:ABC transporter substrate-binding protein [Tengunoibacter tsumagoiensis]GCE14867.1 hypothetical protein KTT_47260 [Tengunoibacter tsumagoiensis]